MAEQMKNQTAPTMEESLNQSEAFLLKYKNIIIGCIVAIIFIIAGVSSYENYVSDHN